MTRHMNRAIRALQETHFDLHTMQEDVQLLVDVATGKVGHAYQGLCPDTIEGFDSRDAECPVCRAIARLEGKELDTAKESACA